MARQHSRAVRAASTVAVAVALTVPGLAGVAAAATTTPAPSVPPSPSASPTKAAATASSSPTTPAAAAPVTHPTVTFRTGCATGITVILGNIAADDSVTSPVTFAVTAPDGVTRPVEVLADQYRRLSFPVAEDTTAGVAVAAPGLARRTVTYAKNCTRVLGEQVVRRDPPAAAPQLPFTGGPTGVLVAAATLLLAGGAAALRIGRRRTG